MQRFLVHGLAGLLKLWPPRRPDFTPLDFSFSGNLKNYVLWTKFAT
jgi:hypothetical protein